MTRYQIALGKRKVAAYRFETIHSVEGLCRLMHKCVSDTAVFDAQNQPEEEDIPIIVGMDPRIPSIAYSYPFYSLTTFPSKEMSAIYYGETPSPEVPAHLVILRPDKDFG